MCLYPKLIDNRKYKPTKKNNYNPPAPPQDPRVLYVPVGCGRCIECTKQKSNGWKIRLHEEIKFDRDATFVTFTFSEESLNKIKEALGKANYYGYEIDNEIASYAVRHFTELWRKHFKKTIKHFLITELGHNGTERIHLHGICWSKNKNAIQKIWKYGYVYLGDYVNEKTINYISKYITKTDIHHKEYKQKIFCSKGLGANYLNRRESHNNQFKEIETNELYRYPNGKKGSLPIYYRNKLWTEAEKEELWKQRMDKEERYVLGQRIDMKLETGEKFYNQALKMARLENWAKGYGTDQKDYNQKKYEEKRKKLKQLTYISNLKNHDTQL